MIKSELEQRIGTQNPHLYQRDLENVVNAILGAIVAAMARGDRVELRGFGAFSGIVRPGPAATHAPECSFGSRGNLCPTSKLARKCACA